MLLMLPEFSRAASSEWELHRAYICTALHLLIFSKRPEPVFSVTTSWICPSNSSLGGARGVAAEQRCTYRNFDIFQTLPLRSAGSIQPRGDGRAGRLATSSQSISVLVSCWSVLEQDSSRPMSVGRQSRLQVQIVQGQKRICRSTRGRQSWKSIESFIKQNNQRLSVWLVGKNLIQPLFQLSSFVGCLFVCFSLHHDLLPDQKRHGHLTFYLKPLTVKFIPEVYLKHFLLPASQRAALSLFFCQQLVTEYAESHVIFERDWITNN